MPLMGLEGFSVKIISSSIIQMTSREITNNMLGSFSIIPWPGGHSKKAKLKLVEFSGIFNLYLLQDKIQFPN